jgi:hypothetical protein
MSGSGRSALLVGATLLGFTAFTPAHAQEHGGATFTTLKENVFICVSPEAYDDAMVRVNGRNGQDLEPVKKELAENKQCMFVDAEMVEGIMAPFCVILQRNGTKVQVQFVVTFRKRIALLHRMINRYVLVGWTEESNLEPKTIL